MSPQDFCYWLQGFMEVSDPKSIDEKQLEVIKKHLALVFTNVTRDKADLQKLLERPYTPGIQLC
jgi:hypothetical protein